MPPKNQPSDVDDLLAMLDGASPSPVVEEEVQEDEPEIETGENESVVLDEDESVVGEGDSDEADEVPAPVTPPTSGRSSVQALPNDLEDLLAAANSAQKKPGSDPDVNELLLDAQAKDPEEEARYASITLAGIRLYRPDLVAALGGRAAAPKTPRPAGAPKPASGGLSAVDSYLNYHKEAQNLLNTDPAQVSGRRYANLVKKYLAALSEKGIDVPAGTTITFAPDQGGKITAVIFGEMPSIPEELNNVQF